MRRVIDAHRAFERLLDGTRSRRRVRAVIALAVALLVAGHAPASAGAAAAVPQGPVPADRQGSAAAPAGTQVRGDFDGDGTLDRAQVTGTLNQGVLTVRTGSGRVVSAPIPLAWDWYQLSTSRYRFGSGDALWVWSVRGEGFQYLVPFGFFHGALRNAQHENGLVFILGRGDNDATRQDFGCRRSWVVSIPLTFLAGGTEQVVRETYRRDGAVMRLVSQEQLGIEPGARLPLNRHVRSGCGLAAWSG